MQPRRNVWHRQLDNDTAMIRHSTTDDNTLLTRQHSADKQVQITRECQQQQQRWDHWQFVDWARRHHNSSFDFVDYKQETLGDCFSAKTLVLKWQRSSVLNFCFKPKFALRFETTVLNRTYVMHLDSHLRLNCYSNGFKPKPLYFPLRPSTKTFR